MSGAQRLAEAFVALDESIPAAQFPLPLDGVESLRSLADSIGHQVRDYLLPRAARLDAPLLAVVGGSTGAGKSTLVNSLLRAQVTRPGVLRPTTKSPVLVCHPDDEAWFRSGRVLPELVRTDAQLHDSRALQIVVFPDLPPGLALLDAPDIDSIDDANRLLARQLMLAADLWLFVTSAARYADAVPWNYLASAAERNVVVGVVVNRCPPGAVGEVAGHLAQLLAERGLGSAKLFAVAERALASDNLLPRGDVSGVKQWLGQLAAESGLRAQVALQSLAGATRALDPQLDQLRRGVEQQAEALAHLRGQAELNYRQATQEVAAAASDATLLRGEILSRWQDLVGTGEFMRGIEERISMIRDRISGWLRGEVRTQAMQAAVSDSLAAVLVEAGQVAAERTAQAWSLTRWGREIVAAQPDLARTSAGFDDAAAEVVRSWQGDILSLVEQEGRGKRRKARLLAVGTNVAGAALIIVVFAATGGLTTAEIGIAGGTSLLAQRLLEAVFGEEEVRRLAIEGRRLLRDRVEVLLALELSRYEEILDQLAVESDAAARLADAAERLRAAAVAAFDDLTAPELT